MASPACTHCCLTTWRVDRDSRGKLTYTYTTSEGRMVRLDPTDVLHIPGLGFDGVMGYSPIALEKSAVGLSIAAEEYGSKFFGNGAMPSGVLTHPNTIKDPKRLRESWNAAYGGSANSGKVAILEESMTFTPISIPNDAAQFLETRKFQVTEICRIFRVPPHMIGDLERATFSNIESQNISFAVHTIRPWLVRIEQAMNRALFPETEKGRFYVQFNLDGLMRATTNPGWRATPSRGKTAGCPPMTSGNLRISTRCPTRKAETCTSSTATWFPSPWQQLDTQTTQSRRCSNEEVLELGAG